MTYDGTPLYRLSLRGGFSLQGIFAMTRGLLCAVIISVCLCEFKVLDLHYDLAYMSLESESFVKRSVFVLIFLHLDKKTTTATTTKTALVTATTSTSTAAANKRTTTHNVYEDKINNNYNHNKKEDGGNNTTTTTNNNNIIKINSNKDNYNKAISTRSNNNNGTTPWSQLPPPPRLPPPPVWYIPPPGGSGYQEMVGQRTGTWSLLNICEGRVCVKWSEFTSSQYGWTLEIAVQLNIVGLFLQCTTLVMTLVYMVTCLFTLPGRRLSWLSYVMAVTYLLSLTMVLVGTFSWYHFIHKATDWELGDSFRSACVGETFLLVAGLVAATGQTGKPKHKTE